MTLNKNVDAGEIFEWPPRNADSFGAEYNEQ
jgi:hypothetical protein